MKTFKHAYRVSSVANKDIIVTRTRAAFRGCAFYAFLLDFFFFFQLIFEILNRGFTT